MTNKRVVSRGEVVQRLNRYRQVAQDIIDGLSGKGFKWGQAQYDAYDAKAEDMRITLVTKTSMRRAGFELRNGAAPVGQAYFGAPIKTWADLYVLECQCKPLGEKAPERENRPALRLEGA